MGLCAIINAFIYSEVNNQKIINKWRCSWHSIGNYFYDSGTSNSKHMDLFQGEF